MCVKDFEGLVCTYNGHTTEDGLWFEFILNCLVNVHVLFGSCLLLVALSINTCLGLCARCMTVRGWWWWRQSHDVECVMVELSQIFIKSSLFYFFNLFFFCVHYIPFIFCGSVFCLFEHFSCQRYARLNSTLLFDYLNVQ